MSITVNVLPGIYKNKKNGHLYRAVGIAGDKTTDDPTKEMVVYQAANGAWHYRTPEDFCEKFEFHSHDVQPRAEVASWAIDMENVLRDHDGKPGKTGWHQDSVVSLFEHLEEEVRELDAEIDRYVKLPGNEDVVAKLYREAIDVSNMAMMVAQQAKAGY